MSKSWLNLTLKMEDELFIERFKRNIGSLTRQELEQYMIESLRQQFIYKNALTTMFKEK